MFYQLPPLSPYPGAKSKVVIAALNSVSVDTFHPSTLQSSKPYLFPEASGGWAGLLGTQPAGPAQGELLRQTSARLPRCDPYLHG